MSSLGNLISRRLHACVCLQRNPTTTPLRLRQRLHTLQSPIPSSARPSHWLRGFDSITTTPPTAAANDDHHSPHDTVKQIVRVQRVQDGFPKRQATQSGLGCILRRRESVPERRREQDRFDAHESIWEAVHQIAVGEARGG
jgi:hypothetical protein